MLRKISIKAHRRTVQWISLILLHSSWGPEAKWLCNPVLSCHSCALAWFACPIGVFVHYAGFGVFPFLALGTVLLLGVFIGRLLCGWMCPFGLVMDLLYKIPSPKFILPPWTAKIKYLVLVVTVILLPYLLGETTWWSFCRFCPASALQVTLPNMALQGTATLNVMTLVKLGMLVLILVGGVLSSRSFCKVLCPIGALIAPLNLITFWKIRVPTANCMACGKCSRACPQNGHPGDRIVEGISPNRELECILCYECQTTCPQSEARLRSQGTLAPSGGSRE